MNIQNSIELKLSVLKPQYLEITNDSASHQNHSGSPNNNQSHFIITIRAETLQGKSLITQHRIINKLLEDEFKKGLHSVSIKVLDLTQQK